MKFNKLKLTALCMSALMVASTVPMTGWAEELTSGDVLTSGEEYALDEAVPAVGEVKDGDSAQNVKFYYKDAKYKDGEATYDYGNGITYTVQGTLKASVPATCKDGGYVVFQATIDGIIYESEKFPTDAPLDHTLNGVSQWETKETWFNDADAPTCTKPGKVYELQICKLCQERREVKGDRDELGHDYTSGKTVTKYSDIDENIKTDGKGTPVFDEKGTAVLVNPKIGGRYTVTVYKVCDRCGDEESEIVSQKTVYVRATEAEEKAVVVIAQTNIDDDLIGLEPKNVPAADKIRLTKCGTKGTYTIGHLDVYEDEIDLEDKDEVEAHLLYDEIVEVPAHHMAGDITFKFTKKELAEQCELHLLDAKGNVVRVIDIVASDANPDPNFDLKTLTYTLKKADQKADVKVVNLNCKNPVPYTKSVLCEKYATCKGVISKEDLTAAVSENHYINKASKDTFDNQKNELTYQKIKELVDVVKVKDVSIGEVTATCTEKGTVEVNFNCMICGKKIQSVKYAVPAIGHYYPKDKDGKEIIKTSVSNRVEPTCTKEGSYDLVKSKTCDVCGHVEEVDRKTVKIDKIAHTNADGNEKNAQIRIVGKTVIDPNYGFYLDEFKASPDEEYAVVGERWRLGDYSFSAYAEVYTACAVCGGNENVVATSLDDYYYDEEDEYHYVPSDIEMVITDIRAQGDRDSCLPGTITLKATYTTEDKKVLTTTKTIPYYTSREEFTKGRAAHTPGSAVKENVVEATEEADGSYDENIYCKVCNTLISSEKKVIPKIVPEKKLAAVTNLKATVLGTGRVSLSWDASEGADGYIILGLNNYRSGSQIGWTAKTTYVDRNADADDFNFYWVIPFYKNDAGKNVLGELSNYVYALARVIGTVNGIHTYNGDGAIDVAWDAASNASSYVVLSKTGSSTAAFNAPVTVKGNSYTDKVEAGTVKFYWVYGVYTNADGKVMAAGPTSTWTWGQAK